MLKQKCSEAEDQLQYIAQEHELMRQEYADLKSRLRRMRLQKMLLLDAVIARELKAVSATESHKQ